jgi:hypothetical protein
MNGGLHRYGDTMHTCVWWILNILLLTQRVAVFFSSKSKKFFSLNPVLHHSSQWAFSHKRVCTSLNIYRLGKSISLQYKSNCTQGTTPSVQYCTSQMTNNTVCYIIHKITQEIQNSSGQYSTPVRLSSAVFDIQFNRQKSMLQSIVRLQNRNTTCWQQSDSVSEVSFLF